MGRETSKAPSEGGCSAVFNLERASHSMVPEKKVRPDKSV